MKVTKDNNEYLVIEVRPGWFEWLLLLFTFVSLFYLVKSYFDTPRVMQNVYGAGGSAIFLFIAYMAFYEKSVFNFNRVSQHLLWNRIRYFKKQSGIVSFLNITSVNLQISTGDDSSPDYRVVMKTDTGDIPITIAYTGNKELCYQTIKRISEILTLQSTDLVMRSAGKMVREGRHIDSVKLLTNEKGVSLTEAKNIVDELKKKD
ncbi:MAG: hypothetical protein GWO07_01135 [Candidatus Dadabacteria bacterium]|nr:hypothetical protein [Candidatus Dadabacteria bacterium]NIS07380.1 hypothetical protein [Candidatus Dadabacteria bacterium]NIV41339.1 hypothetical protein [Candidatus Dadabacteria bacterium]NIX14550.1 hypothetical protein [Candidatus Dadabacteria bacterium]NIY21017.1 hypothetical protein [Candidatus Dadabacteria bacterium]